MPACPWEGKAPTGESFKARTYVGFIWLVKTNFHKTLDNSSITCYNHIGGNIIADKSLPVKMILMVITSQSEMHVTRAESETQWLRKRDRRVTWT